MKGELNKLKYGVSRFLLAIIFAISILLPQSASAVTVGPVKLEYAADPGTVISGELFIKNEEKISRTLYPSVDQFTEQNGEKVFQKEQGLIAEWFETEDSVTLQPDESLKVPFTISVPENAPPGGHFAVIWWSSTPPATSTTQQVSIQTRAGILVYLNISGDIVEVAKIKTFDTNDSKKFFGKADVSFGLVIQNEGNVYIKPKGSLVVKSIFGSTVAEMPVNNKGLQILPKSYRTYGDLNWKGSAYTIGPYKAVVTVKYGSKGQEVAASKWIWIFPIKLVSIVVGLLILLVVFFKLYNRWLMRQFAASQAVHGRKK